MLRAYGNRVLIDVSENHKSTKIELPENVRVEPIARGTVISVGPGQMTTHGWEDPGVKVGDEVTFERARAHVLDKKNFIVALWAGEIMAVEADADLVRRRNGYFSESGSYTSGQEAVLRGAN